MKTISPLRLLFLLLGLLALANTARADCTSPTGIAGDIIYSANYNVPAYCNGSDWVTLAGSSSSGGSASPAGSLNDVQFNNGAGLGADTGNFTYAAGLLTTPNLSAGNVSTTTLSATGLGTLGSLLVAGGATVTGQASLTVISTSLIQVGDNGASCIASLAGGMRYNSTSNTIDYCSGSEWMSLGPSATVVPSFAVFGNDSQTIPTGTQTKVTTFGSLNLDTGSNFSSNRFTVSVPGTYLLTAGIRFPAGEATHYIFIKKNGSSYVASSQMYGYASYTQSVVATGVDRAVAGDYYEVFVQHNSAGNITIPSGGAFSYFSGSLISMAGGGSGGTANPAGSTNDVQFNSGGLLAADTGKFTYTAATGTISITTVSTTALNIAPSISTIVSLNGGSGNMISSGSSVVSASTSGIGIFAGGTQLMSASTAGTTFYSPFTVRSTSTVTGTSLASFVAGSGRQLQINQPDPTDINSPFTFLTPNSYLFMVDTVNALFIDSGGNIGMGIGTASVGTSVPNPGIEFFPAAGTIKIGNNAGSSGSTFLQFLRSGAAIGSIAQNGTTAVAYNTTSDRRVKEDITDTREGLQKLMQLPVRDFAFRADPSHTIVTGFIAQEVEKVFPEAVTTNGDNGEVPLKDKNNIWQVDYGRVTPLIVKSVQDLKYESDARYQELRAENDNLRHEIDDLRQMMQRSSKVR